MTTEVIPSSHESSQVLGSRWSLVEEAADGVFVADLNGCYTDVNIAGCTMLGYSRDEIIGKSIIDFISPEDVGRLAQSKERLLLGGSEIAEWALRKKDGTYLPVEVSAKIHSDGRWKAFVRDITERKRNERAILFSEAKLSGIISISADAIILVDEQHKISLFNEGAETIFGFSKAEALGSSLEILIPERFRAVHRLHVAAFAAGPDMSRRVELPAGGGYGLRKNGEEFPVEAAISKVTVENTKVLAVTLRDITKQKRAEEEIQNYAAELDNAARHKDEFLALLAHELRNPLAPITNALQAMKLGRTHPAAAAETYQIIDRHISQMSRLVEDLLDVSRISQGKIELHKKPFELKEAINGAIETSAPLMESAKHELTVNFPVKPLWVNADPARLIQIFGNLLNNAAKYTPRNGRISLTAMKENNDVLIRIKDEGVGIPSHMLEKIFDLFSQVDTSLERSQGGLGIGLMLCKSLVALHGGSIWATSEGLDKGSEFTVRLPLTAHPKKKRPSQPLNKELTISVEPLRIMVVDDNTASANTMGWMLEMLGHSVQITFDGPSALSMAKSFKPEVVLLDIGMPGMNGYEICLKMRGEHMLKNTVIVAQTGWGDKKHRQRSNEAGFDFHLVKPVRLEAIGKILYEIVSGKRKE